MRRGRYGGAMSLDGFIAGPNGEYGWIPRIAISTSRGTCVVAEPKRQPGKDIAIFGGGELFRSLAGAGLVDSVEMSVVPVMLGRGIPVVPAGSRVQLTLREHKACPKTGTVSLQYDVVRA